MKLKKIKKLLLLITLLVSYSFLAQEKTKANETPSLDKMKVSYKVSKAKKAIKDSIRLEEQKNKRNKAHDNSSKIPELKSMDKRPRFRKSPIDTEKHELKRILSKERKNSIKEN